MSFENKNRVTDKNVGNHVQYKRNTDFTRLRMQNLQKEAKLGASSSRTNERVESLEILKRRSGRTAPGSEISLTGKGLLGGYRTGETSQQSETSQQRRERRQAQEERDLRLRHADQNEALRNANPNNWEAEQQALWRRQIQEIADMDARHERENKAAQEQS
jgi:hypothetical protein